MLNLLKEQTYEYNEQKILVRKGTISGEAEIIRIENYTLVKLLSTGDYYWIK